MKRWARGGFGLPQRPKGTVQQPLTPDLSKYRSRVLLFLALCGTLLCSLAFAWWVTDPLVTEHATLHDIRRSGDLPVPALLPEMERSAPITEPVPPASPSLSILSVPAGQVSLLDLEGELGEWWSEYLKTPKTGPWQKIPKDAKKHQVMLFGFAAKRIIQDHQERVGIYLLAYGDDIIGYSKDPRVKQADRDRQEKLKNLLNSIWPGAMP